MAARTECSKKLAASNPSGTSLITEKKKIVTGLLILPATVFKLQKTACNIVRLLSQTSPFPARTSIEAFSLHI
jgi:hypothetical protein